MDQKDVDAAPEEMRDSLRARSHRPQPIPAQVGLVSSLRPARPVIPWWRQPSLVVGGAIGALLVIAAGAFFAMKEKGSAAQNPIGEPSPKTAEPPVTSPQAAPSEAPKTTHLDPKQAKLSDAWSSAQAKAKEWNKDAVLVSVQAGPMKGNGELDTTAGARISFEFGVPEQGSAATNPAVGNDRFSWTMDAQGFHAAPAKGTQVGHAASDPGCPYDEAIRKGLAAGFAGDRPFLLQYQYSSEREKSVWILQAVDDPKVMRMVDAYSCAILMR